MTEYSWTGNVRELENLIRRLVVLGEPRRAQEELAARIAAVASRNGRPNRRASDHVEVPAGTSAGPAATPGAGPSPVPSGSPAAAERQDLKAIARHAAREAEKRALIEVLERVRWNRAEATPILKVSYKTLLSKLTECGIPPRRGRSD